ncbi:phosphate ABC transporter permease subunit PstC [Pyrobaculum sp.]|uniref:phosphate ABC transporter permease subunit PstC n=1 Tax=Pyrobaculum sp. TaxID=2004705 RepID=UPI00317848B9
MLDVLLLLLPVTYFVSAFVLTLIRFKVGIRLFGLVSLFLIAALVAVFLIKAYPALVRYGPALFTTAEWDPVREKYGLAQAIVGTLITSAIALGIAMPLAVGAAVTINEFLPPRLARLFASLVDLTAAMPTVLYGLWGLFVLGPALGAGLTSLAKAVGLDVLVPPYTLLTAAVLLGIMVTPYASAVIREGYALIPKVVEEAIYSMGATKFEAVVLKLRYVRNYIFGGLFLALGRAMGETVAVAMVVGGNFSRFTTTPWESGITISSLIALQFPNAQSYTYMEPVLFAGALALAALGVAINAAALYILRRWQI